MNNLNVPEDLVPGKRHSLRKEVSVNGWCWVVVTTSFIAEIWLLPKHPEWPVSLRTLIAVIPLLAGILWARSVARWIGGMDELHRRITLAASLFAVSVTLFVIAAWHALVTAGVFSTGFRVTTSFTIAWLVCVFYVLGQSIFNRRYK